MKHFPLAAFVLAAALAAAPASAQQWKPTKHVEFISGSAAGSASDRVLRTIDKMLHDNKLIEATTTVVNKPGAGGGIAWTYLNQQPGDGYHLSLIIGNIITNEITGRSQLSYRDVTCVAQMLSEYTAVGVRADSPIRDAKDLLARLKKDASSVSAAIGTAFGGSGHIQLALATKEAGGSAKALKAVVFPGFGQGVAAVYGGHVDVIANPHGSFLGPMQEGKLRVLAIAAPKRLPGPFANVPTWDELGIDVELEAFRAMAGPKGMGAPQIAYWESRFRELTRTAEWKDMLAKRAWADRSGGPDACKAALDKQYKVMRAGLQELGLAKK
ncbi:MAG TPA: tripartite tricarboxylate transporter substrate binding protein [Burkholderiales bacterium]|nr:tripartite tricarboxylate transporter substrate binding protein [Burkholderiales bacterium]